MFMTAPVYGLTISARVEEQLPSVRALVKESILENLDKLNRSFKVRPTCCIEAADIVADELRELKWTVQTRLTDSGKVVMTLGSDPV